MLTIMDSLELLAACLCEQNTIAGSDEPCFCGVLPGVGLPMDVGRCKGKCGQIYVQLSTSYPATQVGVLDLEPGNCEKGQGFDASIGILRCYPLNKEGKSPPPDVMLEATRQQMVDMTTMRRALSCCEWVEDRRDFVVGQYVPIGPAGGVLGGTFPLSAWLP